MLVPGSGAGPRAGSYTTHRGSGRGYPPDRPADGCPTVRRWMGVGRSTENGSAVAAAAATHQAVRGDGPKLLLVFASAAHDPAEVARGVGAAAPGVPMIGCSAHGEITPGGPTDGTVVVCAIGGPGFSVSTAHTPVVDDRQREAGAEVARCVAGVDDRPYKVMVLFTDGLARRQENVLRGVYGVVGAGVPLFGGAAADQWRMARTFQIHGSEVFTNGAVAACIGSDAPIGIGISHGWSTTGDPMIVTSSQDGRVYQLDDQPALDAYLRRFGAPESIYDDREALRRYVLTRPLGVQRRSGVEVRNICAEVDVQHRTIGGGGDLSQGALAWAMEGDVAAVLDAAENACRAALAPLGGRRPVGMLTLSCAACRAVLGQEGIEQEVSRLAGQAGGVPFAGFYTYGEIARSRGIDGFHNQTMVVLALG